MLNFSHFMKTLLFFFAITLLTATAVQLVVIPVFFPSLCNEDGLLRGIDAIGFHRVAAKKAVEIRETGWSAWELRPNRYAPSGIASIIYYLTVPKPWTLLPLNAFLHALSAALLAMILYDHIGSLKKAVVATLPFLLMPSAYLWVAQIHKDSLFIAGIMLCVFGLDRIASMAESTDFRMLNTFLHSLTILIGALIVWIVRPYALSVILLFLTASCVVIGLYVAKSYLRQSVLTNSVVCLLVLFSLPVILYQFNTDEDTVKSIESKTNPNPRRATAPTVVWQWSRYVPDTLEIKMLQISKVRQKYSRGYAKSGSLIDIHYKIDSVRTFLNFIPRALQVGVLSPFPKQWFEKAQKDAGGPMRLFAAVEMSFIYAVLLFFPISVIQWRASLRFWIVVCFCIGFILIYTFSIPNVGTIYRMRFAFLHTLTAFGIMGFFRLYAWIKKESIPLAR